MSCILLCACASKLDGKTECWGGSLTCGDHELCKDQAVGAADDGGTNTGCVAVPSNCNVQDCAGSACPVCIKNLCDAPADSPTVQGRYLLCRF